MNILNHLAIIMDGNGRWAKNRSLVRTNGHKKGADGKTAMFFAADERFLGIIAVADKIKEDSRQAINDCFPSGN
mgnify:CR=1 FL=1